MEEVIENLPGVSKDLIHEHEELAEKATVLSVITAIAAGFSFLMQRKCPETLNKSIPLVFQLSLITSGVMGASAHEGRKIKHPEKNPTVIDSGGASSGTSNDQN